MSKPRIEHQSLYLSRILACVAVIFLHTLGRLPIQTGSIFTLNWFLQNGIDSFIIWAVPMFVMISGALFLNREYKSPLHFYKTHLPKILGVTFFWFTFYAIADHFTRGDALTPIAYAMRFIIGPYDHLYFLLIIIGLYILVPLLSKVIAKLTQNEHLMLAGIFLFISIFWKLSPFSLTMFIPYIGYFLMGAWLFRTQLPKKVISLSPVGVILFGAATFAFNLFGHLVLHKETYYYLHHHNPFVIGLSLSVFILLNFHEFFTRRHFPHLKQISGTTLGIYLLHPFILTMIVLNLKSYEWYMAFILLPCVFILCFFLTTLYVECSRVFLHNDKT